MGVVVSSFDGMLVQETGSLGCTRKMILRRLKFLCVNYNLLRRDDAFKGGWLATENGFVSLCLSKDSN